MRFKTVEDGLVNWSDYHDTGRLLIHSRDDWDRRYTKVFYRDMKKILLLFGVPLYIVVIVITLFVWRLGIPSVPAFAIGSAVVTSILVGVILYASFHYLWSRHKRPVRGLHERGIMTFGPFIPYEKIKKIEEIEARAVMIKRITYLTLIFGPPDRKLFQPFRTVVDSELLGHDGIAYLFSAVKAAKEGQEGRPAMVVYGGRGGVAKREYVPEVEDV